MSSIRKSSAHWLVGLVVLLIGVIFLIENFTGIEVWERVWHFWPLIFILWGLAELLQKRSIFFGLILLAIGIVFLLNNLKLYLLSGTVWKLWPICIIAIGLDQLINRDEPYFAGQNYSADKKGKKLITYDDEII